MGQSKAGCPSCGYDLSGNTSGVCPECGKPVLRYTDRALAFMVEANRHACSYYRNGNPPRPARWWSMLITEREQINPGHILLGIISGPHGIGSHAVDHCGVDRQRLANIVVRLSPDCIPRHLPDGKTLPLSVASRDIVNVAAEEALQLGHRWVGTEHLLLALCRNPGDNVVNYGLVEANVTVDRVREFVIANMARVSSLEPQ